MALFATSSADSSKVQSLLSPELEKWPPVAESKGK